MMRTLAIVTALLAGCGADSFECELGALDGAWRIHYEEQDGTCGALPDEVTTLMPGPTPGCTATVNETSADRCAADRAFACPIDGGDITWSIHYDQTDADLVVGTGTLTIALDTGAACRSTYEITLERL
jgi:hypothetical protein